MITREEYEKARAVCEAYLRQIENEVQSVKSELGVAPTEPQGVYTGIYKDKKQERLKKAVDLLKANCNGDTPIISVVVLLNNNGCGSVADIFSRINTHLSRVDGKQGESWHDESLKTVTIEPKLSDLSAPKRRIRNARMVGKQSYLIAAYLCSQIGISMPDFEA